MRIVDAHLDLSYNGLRGRQVTQAAGEQAADEQGPPAVGLPDLRRAGVCLVCATIWCPPARAENPGYRTAEEAADMAWRHVRWYRRQFEAAELRLVRGGRSLGIRKEVSAEPHPRAAGSDDHRQAAGPHDGNPPIPVILLMEGADPIAGPGDVPSWHEAGVRAVGLAWQRTRYAGGTGAPGPLTPEGRELVAALDDAGMIHDLSHLAEQSFWELLERARGPVMASHSNCRSIVPTDRQLSDEMIRAVARCGGVIGINLYDRFLLPPGEFGRRRAMLDDVVRHVRHLCDLVGDAGHIGIGSDMDGGFGREHLPREIETAADLPRLAEALGEAGFDDADVLGVMGENWLGFFQRHLAAED